MPPRTLVPAGWRPEPLAQKVGAIDGQNVRAERRVLTLLVIAGAPGSGERRLPPEFERDLDLLAARHGGRRDAFASCGALLAFDDAVAAVRVALRLQGHAHALSVRMGLATLTCELACIEEAGESFFTVLGAEAELAARVEASAAGGILISPSTYTLVRQVVEADCAGGMVAEEFESTDIASASITPAPARGGPELSTFAGLGLF